MKRTKSNADSHNDKRPKKSTRKKGGNSVSNQLRRTKHNQKSSIRKELDELKANGNASGMWGKRQVPRTPPKMRKHLKFMCTLRMLQSFGFKRWMTQDNIRSKWGHRIVPPGVVITKKGNDVTNRCLGWPVTEEILLNKKKKRKATHGKTTRKAHSKIKRTR